MVKSNVSQNQQKDPAMLQTFIPGCLPLLIGSLPMNDHPAASRLIMDYTPSIPLWVQLPVFPEEGMVPQFLPGMPAVVEQGGKRFIDAAGASFDEDLLAFFEAYMAVSEDPDRLPGSRFALNETTGRGVAALLDTLDRIKTPPVAVKGQVTGPITFCTGVKDQDGRAIFYNETLRDAAVKRLALNARWQIRTLSGPGCPVIIFIDEPALAGFGSSELISISKEEILACLREVVDAIHTDGGLAGIHVCANTDWSLVLESGADIVNFDAYAYFDRFVLYGDPIRAFLAAGGMLAWGIVPTLEPETIRQETVDTLYARWQEQFRQIEALGFAPATLFAQSFITPSCGVGSLSLDLAKRVLALTRDLSATIRDRF
jgi:methionine synthase II (cobalamin-independent)